jgi:hypothetical protein
MILKFFSNPTHSNVISFDKHFVAKFMMLTVGRFIVYHGRSVSKVGVTASVLLFQVRFHPVAGYTGPEGGV